MIHTVLVSTINHDHPQRGMEHAFRGIFKNVDTFDFLDKKRKGVSVDIINRELLQRASAVKPDWIWFQLQESNVIKAETIREIRTRSPKTVISHWMGDCRLSVPPGLGEISKACHLTLVSNSGQIPLFQAAGASIARYLQVAVDWEEDLFPKTDHPLPFPVRDVAFCGNYYGNSFPGTVDRVTAIRALMDAGVSVGIVGSNWPVGFPVLGICHVKEQVHVYRKAKVALSVNHFNTIERYYSDRQLIAMGSGTPLVSIYVPGLEKEFEDGKHCLWYRSISELIDHVKMLLSDRAKASLMGRNGRAEVIRSHTYFSRILSILPEIEQIRSSL
jgi:hypothetical protein